MSRTPPFAVVTALLLLGPSLAAAAEPARKERRPNVVIVLIDDMGYGDFGCYGCKDTRTPNADKLAKQGVRLTDFYAAPVCTPTRAALMTGRWQQRVGLEWAIGPGLKAPGLPAKETSLARMLKDAGYATALCGKWHLGYKPEFGPNAHGFDEFYGLLSGNVDHYSHKEINGEADWHENTKAIEAKGYSTDLITERALKFIDNNAKKPFFLYVAYNAVHWPFQPPGKPDDVRTRATWFDGDRKSYVAMVEAVDAGVGKLMAALDKHGLTDDTLFILTNDNGGERYSDNGPLSGRKGSVYEGGIRVPCIVRWPGHVPAGKVSAYPSIMMDLTATALAAAGASPPKGRKLDGIDLLPVLNGKAGPERALFWRIDRREKKQQAVRKGKWKYVEDGKKQMLFDLESDPGEKKDLAAEHPDKVKELRGLYEEWEKEMAKEKPAFVVK